MLKFYWQWVKLTWGAAAWTRATNGTLVIFLPLLSWIPTSEWFRGRAPQASAWVQSQPTWLPWLPLILFACLFLARLMLAPYWLYRDKPKPASVISKDQTNRLTLLWREGSSLYEKRVQHNHEFVLWQNDVREWASAVVLELYSIDPGESFAFESIGFQHRQNQNRNEDKQYESMRSQLGDRLGKLRLTVGRHLQATM